MNQRERLLALGLLVLVIGGGGLFLYKSVYLSELDDRRAAIERYQRDIEQNEERILQIQKQKKILEVARQLSLPADVDLDRREYQKYLEDLLRRSGFASGSFRISSEPPDTNSSPKLTAGKKDPIYTSLPFTVQAHGSLSSLVDCLERFYHTGLLHRVKGLQITRPLTSTTPQQQRSGELDFKMTIEALVLTGADSRPYLLPNLSRRLLFIDIVTALRRGPVGLALVPWAVGPAGPLGPHEATESFRKYAAIAGKNIFFGPQPVVVDRTKEDVELTRYVYLTHTSRDDQRVEAFLYDRYNNRQTRLRTSPGFDSFRVMDLEGEPLVRGKVIQINQREIVFRVDENYHVLHIGQNLEDALKTSLTAEQLKKLGLAAAPVKKDGAGQ